METSPLPGGNGHYCLSVRRFSPAVFLPTAPPHGGRHQSAGFAIGRSEAYVFGTMP
jgi:hypothetical protein